MFYNQIKKWLSKFSKRFCICCEKDEKPPIEQKKYCEIFEELSDNGLASYDIKLNENYRELINSMEL